jgi:predicted amidohydrolase
MDVALSRPDRNVRRMIERLAEAATRGARLIVFPEAVVSGYCFETLEEARAAAQPVPGDATQRMVAACGEHGVHAVFGMTELDGERLFNSAVLAGPAGVVDVYRKLHLPELGLDRLAAPGDRPLKVSEIDGVRVGMHICYDGAFPECPRVMALAGADILVLPTNWPPGAEVLAAHGPPMRAMENRVNYVAVNRVGEERGFRFIGQSKICDPDGHILAEAAHADEAILYAELDIARARQKRIVRVPGKHAIERFKARRPDMYETLVEPLK